MQDTGKPPVPIRWPNDARIAMSIVVAFEAFTYVSHYRSRASVGGKVEADQASLSYAEYGPKVGVWRLLDLLDREGLKASFHVSGKAAQDWPLTLKEVFRRGHEVVGHGWTNDNLSHNEYTEERERKDILDTIAAIEAATGEKPIGWSSPGSKGSANKFRVLVEESGVRWIGDDASNDVPFLHRVDSKTIVMMPRNSFPANDLQLWLTPSNPPDVYFDSFKDAFDCLYEEGRNGSPKWTEAVIHCHIGARPGLQTSIKRVIDYAKKHEKVWFARRRDIADHMLKTYA